MSTIAAPQVALPVDECCAAQVGVDRPRGCCRVSADVAVVSAAGVERLRPAPPRGAPLETFRAYVGHDLLRGIDLGTSGLGAALTSGLGLHPTASCFTGVPGEARPGEQWV